MSKVKQVKLGNQGLVVPTIGLGCMGMSTMGAMNVYGEANDAEIITTIERSLELGGNFLDTADLYGPFKNEQLISKVISGRRDQFIIASKFGFKIDNNGAFDYSPDASASYVKMAIERSLKNLNTDYIDLYYMHTPDPNTPIEETVEAMANLVKEGKIRYIGLSNVDAETVRRAHKIHPISAIQSEYSLFESQVKETGLLSTLDELGIGFVAYSPLGRGFISGDFKHPNDIPEGDIRRYIKRFQDDNFYKNLELLNEVEKIAKEKNVTTSQIAIAWVVAQGYVPIPGTKKVKYVEQNIEATNIELSANDLKRLEDIMPLAK